MPKRKRGSASYKPTKRHRSREEESPKQRQERLTTDAARQQHQRQQETPTEAQERRAANAKRQRQHETPKETRERLATDATRHQHQRQHETPKETRERLATDATRHQHQRQHETPTETQERRAANAKRQRQHETRSQTHQRLAADTTRHQQQRQHETGSQTQQRLAADTTRHQQLRQNETESQTQLRLEKDAVQHQRQRHAETPYIARQTFATITPFYIGPLTVICRYCRALRFKNEALNCCHKGKVALNALSPYPIALHRLLTGPTEETRNFNENIRQYNSAFAFASLGAQIVQPRGRGPYCFRIHGQIYHRSGTLHPPEGTNRQFGQVYILEGNQAVEARMQQKENEHCRNDVMTTIQNVMEQVNPFAAAFKHMHEVENTESQRAAAEGTQPSNVTMFFRRGKDQRRYNEPRHDEVAAVFVGEEGAPPFERDIVVYPHNRPHHLISYMSSNCDPMVYPLLFPRGDLGWFDGMQHAEGHRTAKRHKVTLLQFYSYRLAVRQSFSPIHAAKKLFQQYMVDAYVKTEASRLDYIRRNQSGLRVELYQGLMDHLHSQPNQQNLPAGRIVILPSSFQGSPRAMQQSYQDAMAIVTKHGKPDLFLTFTCSPKSREIKENLHHGQQPHDRPDLVARVFSQQLAELKKDIMIRHVLGKPLAMIYVIEFQKRGLPHCHMLIILDAASKLRTPDDINTIISAEIPNYHSDPDLYEIIKSNMVHGPCGILNPQSVCMEDKVCSKDYPKEFNNRTNICVDGYPLYRRRDNGETMTVRGVQVDNRWIVPHNPWLSKKYKAHINLEACMSIKSVKYLFKYVYKGYDCANIEVQETTQPDHDEISTFLDVRYVSAPEAAWRLFEYPMHYQSHAVTRLAVHLPFQQPVYFHRGQEEEAMDRATTQQTHLTAWFQLNQTDNTAKDYLYSDIPNHYVFNQSSKKWQPRKRKNKQVLPRLYSASPKNLERFHLRLLLLHKPGATSFENLRTIDGHTCESFKEACQLLGLLADDTEWDKALTEASAFQMPCQLRALFATICTQCLPTDPKTLWTTHKQAMTEDYLHNHSSSDPENQALQHIQSIISQFGLSCSDIGLPAVQEVHEVEEFIDVAAEREFAQTNLAKLNPEQKFLADTIFSAIQQVKQGAPPECRAYFLDGPGGTGKTMLYNTLMAALHADELKVTAAAWTGIAATLLHRGRTVHTLFKLPVPIVDTSTCNISPSSKYGAMIRSLDLIIIDEASMVPIHALHAIDKLLRDLTGQDIPFGGKVFLLGGDFRQVLPVLPKSSPTAIVENCLKSSPLWPSITKISLTKNMRAKPEEQEFAAWLIQLGNGQLHSQCEFIKPDTIDIPAQCVITDNIIDEVFPTMTELATQQVILTPKNDESLLLNNQVLAKVPGEGRTYYSCDRVICDNQEEQNNYPMEFVNSITPTGMPPHCLTLKKGAVVMLLRNLDIKHGLCNGTRLIIRHMYDSVLDAEILSGDHHGQRVLLPRIRLAPSDPNLPFTLERRQFPLRLAYAMTINKAQGQTFDKLGIYLPSPVFSHGQLYVAFSRARAFSDISVQILPSQSQGCTDNTHFTTNVVYPAIL